MAEDLSAFSPIASERLLLRPLQDGDAEPLRAMTDDAEILAAIPFLPDRFTAADARQLIGARAGGRECFIGVRRRTDDGLVGVIGAHLRGEEELEIGYWIGSADQGRGYATEAVAALLPALRRACPGRTIVAECLPENRVSWRVLEKLGFRATGAPGTRSGRKHLALPQST